MQQISQIPLLTVEEEIELAAKITKGDEEARDTMITANLRLVVKIAQEYSNLGLSILDLINEGNMGLMKAVERFDPSKGGKLSTYASWWIKQAIKRALANQSKTIRLPVHMVDRVPKYAFFRKIVREIRCDPTDDELAEELSMPTARISHLRNVSLRPASLDSPINDEDGSTLGEIVPDEQSVDPLESLQSKSLVGDVNQVLAMLEPREADIIIRLLWTGMDEILLPSKKWVGRLGSPGKESGNFRSKPCAICATKWQSTKNNVPWRKLRSRNSRLKKLNCLKIYFIKIFLGSPTIHSPINLG